MSTSTEKTTKSTRVSTRKPAAKPSAHPPTALMVSTALAALNDKKGSSLSAIKKYVESSYDVDMVRLAPFFRRSVKKSVTKGILKQTSGVGASGKFKLDAKPAEKTKSSAKKVARPTAKKPKKTTGKAKTTLATAAKAKKIAKSKPKSAKPKIAAKKASKPKVSKA